MKVPFSPPRVDSKIINEVSEALQSGWITTGPRTKQFEKDLVAFCGGGTVLCLSSATSGLELVLRWFGVKEGDEVILPAYTYCATANVVVHCGAKPVFVDVNPDDFLISVKEIEKAITKNTKVIMPVDFGGMPCDYDKINALVNCKSKRAIFNPETEEQEKLGRILVLSDAAHSLGAWYKGKSTGLLTDITVFSFHAVKNLTTAEGGAIVFNLPEPFSNEELYKWFNVFSLHGQSKDALAKVQVGGWKYDVTMPGFKANMTDVLASMGLVELRRYRDDMLPKLRYIFERYNNALAHYPWAILPVMQTAEKCSSYHIYPLRIKGFSEKMRDELISKLAEKGVTTNVHFIPIPELSYYKNEGYSSGEYPNAFNLYLNEISLPVYYDLKDIQIDFLLNEFIQSVNRIFNEHK